MEPFPQNKQKNNTKRYAISWNSGTFKRNIINEHQLNLLKSLILVATLIGIILRQQPNRAEKNISNALKKFSKQVDST